MSIGFFFGGKSKTEITGIPIVALDMSYTGLDLGLLGKFPVALSDKFAVFPLLGITYRVMLSVKDSAGEKIEDNSIVKSKDFSALWFKLGGGLDFSFTDNLFLRGAALYGIRLSNKYEKDAVDLYKKVAPYTDVKSLLGHGFEVKLALGCRF